MTAIIAYFAGGFIIILTLWGSTKIDFTMNAIIAGWSLLQLFLAITASFLIMVAFWPVIIGKLIYAVSRTRHTNDKEP